MSHVQTHLVLEILLWLYIMVVFSSVQSLAFG